MPHASKPVRYNVSHRSINPSAALSLGAHATNPEILRSLCSELQPRLPNDPLLGPPMYSTVFFATKRATVSNNMPANFVCFCVWHIYILCALFCYRNRVLVSIDAFFISEELALQHPGWKSNGTRQLRSWALLFACCTCSWQKHSQPIGKSAVILYLKRTLSLAPSTHPLPSAFISRFVLQ